ncbi:TRADD-N-associated membrane domain-containing protein [Bacillus wiedmannii]|uniref:TRADD-N-associated membrane domain-containing protein n=1 Tax=Bacillus wiedmannii TaxID=1890302 RepID=UPI00352B6640
MNFCVFVYFIYIAGEIIKRNSYGIYTKPIMIILTAAFTFFFVYFLIEPIRKPANEYVIELQEVENELDLLIISHSSLEERSEKLFKHHHLELKRYYDENLKQSSWIFVVGIACILIGFAIIGITLYFLIANSSNELENKIIVASVGAIGAILSNFIAVIYLKMHSEAVKSLTEFHNRFVNTHHFYFSNFLLSKIQNEDKREDALVELALKINGISPKPPAQGEESK